MKFCVRQAINAISSQSLNVTFCFEVFILLSCFTLICTLHHFLFNLFSFPCFLRVTSTKLNLEEVLCTKWKPWSSLLLRFIIVFGTVVICYFHFYVQLGALLEHYAYLVICDKLIKYMQNSSRRAEIEAF